MTVVYLFRILLCEAVESALRLPAVSHAAISVCGKRLYENVHYRHFLSSMFCKGGRIAVALGHERGWAWRVASFRRSTDRCV